MRKFVLIILAANLNLYINAQSMEFLDANRVKAAFWADGSMFWDKVSSPLFEWPQDSGTHVNFSTGLWFGGVTSNGTIKGAYKTYDAMGIDYFPGPLILSDGSVDSSTMAVYNKVWKINKTEVDLFRYCHCTNPGDPLCNGYTIPNSILDWPGNPVLEADGDNNYMDPYLAPFYDQNGNGIYEPSDCDYPLVKCDQSLFFVFNDRGGLHQESQLPSVGLEVRALAYACRCDSAANMYQGIDDAIFLDLQVIHRGSDTLFQSYLGLFSDGDIGGTEDDFMGTNVQDGYVYHYNGDAFDEDYVTTQGYGSLPPAHAIVHLEGPWMDPNGVADFWDPAWDPNSPPSQALLAINQLATDAPDISTTNPVFGINGKGFNDSIIDNERLGLNRSMCLTPPVNPGTGNAFYNLERAIWTDGVAQVFGCNGYPAFSCASAPRAYFVFPDTSDLWNWGTKGIATAYYWKKATSGVSVNDMRSVSAAGPFTLIPGETNTLTYAFVTARSTTPTDIVSLAALNQAIINVKDYYNQGVPGCITHVGVEELGEEPVVKLYPNPANQTIWLESNHLENANIRIVDITGRCVYLVANQLTGSTVSIPVEQLVPGIYTITITRGGFSKSMKFIRN